MQFKPEKGYDSDKLFSAISNAINFVNINKDIKRKFAEPQRADQIGDYAHSITDSIVESILHSHFFIADLTNNNPGVLLELGLALAFKRHDSILVINHDDYSKIHFDIKSLNIKKYETLEGLKNYLQKVLPRLAEDEEDAEERYFSQIRKKLQVDSIVCMVDYAKLYRFADSKSCKDQPPLIYENSSFIDSASNPRPRYP